MSALVAEMQALLRETQLSPLAREALEFCSRGEGGRALRESVETDADVLAMMERLVSGVGELSAAEQEQFFEFLGGLRRAAHKVAHGVGRAVGAAQRAHKKYKKFKKGVKKFKKSIGAAFGAGRAGGSSRPQKKPRKSRKKLPAPAQHPASHPTTPHHTQTGST